MSDPTPPISSTAEYYRPVEVFVAHPPKPRYWIHILLLALTIFTTLVMGARMEFNFLNNQRAFSVGDSGSLLSLLFGPFHWVLVQPSRLLLGIPFAATLMSILLAHEMGHYLYCQYYGVYATLPFFIPAPTLIGTLGAFIRIRSPIRSRSALFDIGIAGPIAGFVVAAPVMLVALRLSKPAFTDADIGFPLIFVIGQHLLKAAGVTNGIAALPLDRVLLHPTAIAAWVGMFATSLNLLPGGQLDGGHIVFSMAPRAHRWVSRITIAALLPMAYYLWAGWLLWAVLLAISGMRHPTVPHHPGVTGGRRWLALFALLMLILTLTPAPFIHGSFVDVVRELRSGQ